jgi:hypothetical protein
MTACWRRLTQPEKEKNKRPAVEAAGPSPERAQGAARVQAVRGWGHRRLADRAEVPETQASSEASTRLFLGRSVLARVFALDAISNVPTQALLAVHILVWRRRFRTYAPQSSIWHYESPQSTGFLPPPPPVADLRL